MQRQARARSPYSDHLAYRWVHRFFPVWPRLFGHNFFLNAKELEEARSAHPDVHLELAGEDVKHPEKSHPHQIKKGAWVATPLKLFCAQPQPLSGSNLSFSYHVSGGAPNGATIAAPTVTYQSD